MTEVKFSGSATITGFPRDKAFGFEIEGDRLILKAGKEIFLTVEKEPAPTKPEIELYPDPPKTTLAEIERQVGQIVAPPAESTTQVLNAYAQGSPVVTGETEKTRKTRSPNVVIDENLLIFVDASAGNPYRGLRGKYFETLRTASGRPVSWWKQTSMVNALEGNPLTMLKFFISEGSTALMGSDTPTQNVVPIQPQGGPLHPNQGADSRFTSGPVQPNVAGPIWAGGVEPGKGGGATFL